MNNRIDIKPIVILANLQINFTGTKNKALASLCLFKCKALFQQYIMMFVQPIDDIEGSAFRLRRLLVVNLQMIKNRAVCF